jgi:fimbrial chaperone protein
MTYLAALAGTIFIAWSSAHAAEISVLPVGLTFSPGHGHEAITVSNHGDQDVVLQVEPVAWTQVQGRDRLDPTSDLLINPPLFSIKARASQILRVGLRKTSDHAGHRAYRLLLREVPPAPLSPPHDSTPGQVRVLLEIRLPVYVMPPEIIRSQVWEGHRTGANNIAISVKNTGNVHMVVSGLALREAGESPPGTPVVTKTSAAVFPGQSRSWELPMTFAPDRALVLEAQTDQGVQKIGLEPGAP